MTVKHILVETKLHNRVKAAAALQEQTIRNFTEDALREWLKTARAQLLSQEADNE